MFSIGRLVLGQRNNAARLAAVRTRKGDKAGTKSGPPSPSATTGATTTPRLMADQLGAAIAALGAKVDTDTKAPLRASAGPAEIPQLTSEVLGAAIATLGSTENFNTKRDGSLSNDAVSLRISSKALTGALKRAATQRKLPGVKPTKGRAPASPPQTSDASAVQRSARDRIAAHRMQRTLSMDTATAVSVAMELVELFTAATPAELTDLALKDYLAEAVAQLHLSETRGRPSTQAAKFIADIQPYVVVPGATERLLNVVNHRREADPATTYLVTALLAPAAAIAMSCGDPKLRALVCSADPVVSVKMYLADAICEAYNGAVNNVQGQILPLQRIKLYHLSACRLFVGDPRFQDHLLDLYLLASTAHAKLLHEHGRMAMWTLWAKTDITKRLATGDQMLVLYAIASGAKIPFAQSIFKDCESRALASVEPWPLEHVACVILAAARACGETCQAMRMCAMFWEYARVQARDTEAWLTVCAVARQAPDLIGQSALHWDGISFARVSVPGLVTVLETFSDALKQQPFRAIEIVRELSERYRGGLEEAPEPQELTLVRAHRVLASIGFFSIAQPNVLQAGNDFLLSGDNVIGRITTLHQCVHVLDRILPIAPSHARRFATVVRTRLSVLVLSASPEVKAATARMFAVLDVMTPSAHELLAGTIHP
jgi:hypothetical protein